MFHTKIILCIVLLFSSHTQCTMMDWLQEHPKKISFIFAASALFAMARSFFLTLTSRYNSHSLLGCYDCNNWLEPIKVTGNKRESGKNSTIQNIEQSNAPVTENPEEEISSIILANIDPIRELFKSFDNAKEIDPEIHIDQSIINDLRKKFCKLIFSAKYTMYNYSDYKYAQISLLNFSTEKTICFISLYSMQIFSAFTFLLTHDHTRTQEIFNAYVEKIYQPKDPVVLKLITSIFGHGIDPRQAKGSTLLMKACVKDDAVMVSYLLKDMKINPDDEDWQDKTGRSPFVYEPNIHYQGYNPLLLASQANAFECVKILTEHNTNTHPFWDIGAEKTAIDHARSHKNKEMFNHLMFFTLKKNGWNDEQLNNLTQNNNMVSSSKIIDDCFKCDEKAWPYVKGHIGHMNYIYPRRIDSDDLWELHIINSKKKLAESFLLRNGYQ